ncbi:alpha/beta hydrolase family esterase [Novispirillum sp. DQ9]|uniref:extracellular catalytic domain type 1 short-chain-length polyhydroxyalkanoate depolymerase n=1 Tax=Novispirillum sp. DQ9 TaxID=3398612 RepID=UPI003C7D6913
MTYAMPPDMFEAARLTQAGKLAEATALIQRTLGGVGGRAPQPAPFAGPKVLDAEFRVVDGPRSASGATSGAASTTTARPRAGLGETLRRLAEGKGLMKNGLGGLGGLGGGVRAPAPPLPEGARFDTAAHSGAAGSRSYKLYTPANRPAGPRPLVVMLHGCTQNPDDFAAGTGMNAVAEEHGLLVVYPEQPASANPQRCWNWFSPQDQGRDRGEPSLIAGIVRQVQREHEVDAGRIYIAGLSAGGAAAAIVGAAYPDLFAGIGVHSGLPLGAASDIPSAFTAMRQGPAAGTAAHRLTVPTIVFHGDMDHTVSSANADAVVGQATAAAAGLDQTTHRGTAPGGLAYSRTVHATPDGRAHCEHWTIHGAGHAWAGGTPAGSYTDPRGPDAAREFARFFLEQPPLR